MKEIIKAGTAQHYEWVVSNGKSKIGRAIDFLFCLMFIAVVIGLTYITTR